MEKAKKLATYKRFGPTTPELVERLYHRILGEEAEKKSQEEARTPPRDP